MLGEVYSRYRRPFFIAETSHYGVGRAPWIREIAAEIVKAIQSGVPLGGACLYPILDRYDWEDRSHWHNCGLWDLDQNEQGHYDRVLNRVYAEALREAQELIANMSNDPESGKS